MGFNSRFKGLRNIEYINDALFKNKEVVVALFTGVE